MSQIDKVVYLPILFWFWLFFISLYIFLFSNFLTYIYTVFRIRNFYIDDLIVFCFNTFYFTNFFIFFCLDFINKKYFKNMSTYLRNKLTYELTISLKKNI